MGLKRKTTFSLLPYALILCLCTVGLVALGKGIAGEVLSDGKTYHIVREGDTLWGITGHYYEDPFLWPAVWGHNPHITNPHWIYPGDPIYLATLALARAPLADVAPEPPAVRSPPPLVRSAPAAFPDVSSLTISRFMADTALVTTEGLKETGRVLAGRDDKILLAQGDEIFIQLSGPGDASSGAVYQIMRALREIRHPKTGKNLGTLYGILGYARVAGEPEGSVMRARILASQCAVEAGDILRKGAPPPKEVYSDYSKRDLRGWIVAGLRSDELLSEYDVCFIDKGIEEGVQVGDTFWALEAERQVENPQGPGKVTLPDTRLALLVVIHAEQNTATALVTNSQGAFAAGHRVQSRMQ